MVPPFPLANIGAKSPLAKVAGQGSGSSRYGRQFNFFFLRYCFLMDLLGLFNGADKKLRPYLWLASTTPYGGNEIAISGLVDTGADRSVLLRPRRYPAGWTFGIA